MRSRVWTVGGSTVVAITVALVALMALAVSPGIAATATPASSTPAAIGSASPANEGPGAAESFIDGCTGDTVAVARLAAATAQAMSGFANRNAVNLELTGPVLATDAGQVTAGEPTFSTTLELGSEDHGRVEHVFALSVGAHSTVELRYGVDVQANGTPTVMLEQINGYCGK